MNVRSYTSYDYDQLVTLYKKGELFGGQFDENRDSEEKLRKRVAADPDAILVAEEDGKIIGTVSLIEDGRVAWLFRFCVVENPHKDEIATLLNKKVEGILKSRGHNQIMIYTGTNNKSLHRRYEKLGFNKGNNYSCFWKNI